MPWLYTSGSRNIFPANDWGSDPEARKAFFQFSSIYAFQESLSTASICSIVQWCVLPILLYAWCRKLDHVSLLRNFRGKQQNESCWCLNATPTRLPAQHEAGTPSTLCALLALKLRFLHWAWTNEESICYCMFLAMVDNVKEWDYCLTASSLSCRVQQSYE